ncbi:MAG: transcription termination factor NusA [Lachnospiraceae bacterium]|nr:transcription termination factor NusA [Lachnospiraceae bacterium]
MDKDELLFALNTVENEKSIDKDSLIEAIKGSILNACKQYFGTAENISVEIDATTGENHVYASKKVVDVKDLQDEALELTLEEAHEINSDLVIGDVVRMEIDTKSFGRIVTNSSKNMIIQKIREDERNTIYNEFYEKEHQVVTGIVQRYSGDNISINLGRADAILTKNEQIEGEHYKPTDRIKVYILEVRNTQKGLRMRVSRTHPELVKKLFEEEVTEVKDGIVEIKAIAREAGNRSKIAVWSNDPDVDPVGACVGMNGSRVNAIVSELHNEKIDIINWDENPAYLIQNALSPAMVISVIADSDEKSAKVVVPDDQLSLAIGMKGQNARLAARLTGFKIDIKSETQARESGDFIEYDEEYDEEYYDEEFYDEEEE